MLIAFPVVSNAVTFDSYFDIIYPEKNFTPIRITNETNNRAHVVSVEVWEINNPFERKPVETNNSNDVVFTPAKQLINPSKSAYFKFIYNGKQDEKERYYSIRWRDAALMRTNPLNNDSNIKAQAQATVNTSVVTTLIVNPRKSNVSLVKSGDYVINNGNSMVSIFLNAKCKSNNDLEKEDCSIYRPFFPGQKISVERMRFDNSFSAGYWLDGKKAKSLDFTS